MVTPLEYILEAQKLFAEGWGVSDIKKHFTSHNKKIGVNTLYQIKRGEFKPAKRGKNVWYMEGESQRAQALEEKVENHLESIRDDVVKRTTVIETTADMEVLSRLTQKEERAKVSMADLTKVADSAAKRKALAENKPTDIFKIFDEEMSNKEIIEVIQEHERPTKTNKEDNHSGGHERSGGSPEEEGEVRQAGEALPAS